MDYEEPIVAGDLEAWFSKRFARSCIDPWAAAYVTVDDTLLLRVWSPIATSTVNLSLRYQGVNGEIRPEFYSFSVNTPSGGFFSTKIPGSEGWLLSATAECPGTVRGQCFVALEVQRGLGASDLTFGQELLAEYPGVSGRIGYPQSVPASPTAGRGAMRSIPIANPAAGADFSLTVPAGVHWIIRAATGQLVTSATVATRQASLELQDAALNVILRSAASATQAASLTQVYSWFNGGLANSGTPVVDGGLPAEFRLLAGWKIASATANIQAADQWSAIVFGVEEFIAA